MKKKKKQSSSKKGKLSLVGQATAEVSIDDGSREVWQCASGAHTSNGRPQLLTLSGWTGPADKPTPNRDYHICLPCALAALETTFPLARIT